MAYDIETDVLIVGGGPSGAAAALGLLAYSPASVVVVERSAFDTCRTGEQVNASLFDLLAYLKIEKSQFADGSFVQSYTSLAAWGSEQLAARYSIFSTSEESYQLNREEFDLLLLREAVERGATVLPRTKCMQFRQLANGHWEAWLNHAQRGDLCVKARFLVDATGRQCNVARQLGLVPVRHDQLAAVGAFLHFEEALVLQQRMVLETVAEGWWYCSTLPSQRMTATLFTDADIVKKQQLHKPRNWAALLAGTKHIRTAVRRAAHGEVWVRNAFSQVSDSTARANFIAVGDAAAAFDPIASMGIGFALSSGCHAARAIGQAQAGDPTAVATYQRDVEGIFKNYLETKAQFYNKERRWQNAVFWERRLAG
jgi:flavin-dependent dehydrogenase